MWWIRSLSLSTSNCTNWSKCVWLDSASGCERMFRHFSGYNYNENWGPISCCRSVSPKGTTDIEHETRKSIEEIRQNSASFKFAVGIEFANSTITAKFEKKKKKKVNYNALMVELEASWNYFLTIPSSVAQDKLCMMADISERNFKLLQSPVVQSPPDTFWVP